MTNDKVQLFEDRSIRTAWIEDEEEWYFSVVDVVGTLTEQIDYEKARKYWNKLKQRLKEEGSQLVTNCHQLKMTAQDGKKRMTDVANTEQLLRIIQSIPSKKAEPFKMWLAQVGRERIEKVNGANVWDVLKLSVDDNQKEFVANNEVSIIEAYTAITANGFAFPFGIFDDDILVGFLMVGFDKDDYWDDAPAIATGNYNLWRLMIDKKYQHKGYGRKAVELALDFIRTLPCGSAECCWLSYEPENTNAKNLYASFGFSETGDMDGEEIIAALKL